MSKNHKHELVPTLQDDAESVVLSREEQEVLEKITGGRWKKYGRVAMAALGGITWVGGFLSAAASLNAENEQEKTNRLFYLWVREHEDKLRQLVSDLRLIFDKLDGMSEDIKSRIESQEYLNLVRKTFRVWDIADTQEKREMLRKLITNAGGTSIVQDEIIRLFIEFIEKFNELHFKILREIYLTPGITLHDIALKLFKDIPRDDSSKADLFKCLMHDLNMTDVVRGIRESDEYGRWKVRPRPKKQEKTGTLKTPFNENQQVLTELGAEFVRYVMNDLDLQLNQ